MNQQKNIYADMVSNPLVPMTLRIGVAGHRLLPDTLVERIREKIRVTYAAIAAAVQMLHADEIAAVLYAHDSAPVIRVITSLAEGADRLCIAPELLPPAFDMAAILPFLTEDYRQDFCPGFSAVDRERGTATEFDELLQRIVQMSGQVIELDGNPDNREQAYIECSYTLAAHSDILIAIYDGDQNELKGTAATVDYARRNGVPVIHISTLDAACKLYFSDRSDCENDPVEFSQEALQQELRRILLFTDILAFPGSGENAAMTKHRRDEILNRLKRYRDEDNLDYDAKNCSDFAGEGPIVLKQKYKSMAAKAFDCFKACIATPQKIQNELNKTAEHKGESATVGERETICEKLITPSLDRYFAAYLRADRLASYYSHSHRSTFLWIYMLGAAALITAACALAFKTDKQLVLFFVLIECVLLAGIYWLYRQDHKNAYHDRWLEYRCLAEFLRPMRYLALLGSSYTISRFRSHEEYRNREVIGHGDGGRSWLYLYSETVIRWVGFNSCRMEPEYKENVRRFIIRTWLEGQINYHRHNAAAMRVLGHELSQWSYYFFIGTVLIVGFKLLTICMELLLDFSIIPHALSYVVALGAAVLPICATTAFAIRNHAEFDISAQRSLTMRNFLKSKGHKLVHVTSPMSSMQMTTILNQIAADTIKETAEWLEIYEVKETEPS